MGDYAEVTPRLLVGRASEIPRSDGVVDFERLYHLHVRRIYRLCWQMVCDKADAEDLTQEVFIQVFRKIDTFRGEAAFTTWLHRLAVNLVLMRLRKKSRLEPSLGEGAEHCGQPGRARESLADPVPAMAGTLDRLDLERALAQLPPGFRDAVLLHDVEGYGHREIARMLGVSAGTSKSQLHKARLRLRDLLHAAARRPGAAASDGLPRPVSAATLRKKTTDRGTWLLPAQGNSLRKTLARALDRAHTQSPVTHRTLPRDEFEYMGVDYGKVKCA